MDSLKPFILSQENKKKQIVIALSDGSVYSFSGEGSFLWKVKTISNWNKNSLLHQSAFPSLNLFQILSINSQLFSTNQKTENLFLYIGNKYLSILNPSGYMIEQQRLPSLPLMQPIIGDWNNDGLNDFIIVTLNSIQGYSFHARQNTSLLPLLVSSLLTIIIFTLIIYKKK